MGNKLDPKENELYQRVDEVLHYIWDPIGVYDEPYARDEYYSYVPIIYSLLKETKDGKEIEDKLVQIQRDQIGLSLISIDRIKNVVELLITYRNIIFNEATQPPLQRTLGLAPLSSSVSQRPFHHHQFILWLLI